MVAPRKARILSLAQSLDQRPQGASKLRPSPTAGSRQLHLSHFRLSIPVCFQWKGVPGTASGNTSIHRSGRGGNINTGKCSRAAEQSWTGQRHRGHSRTESKRREDTLEPSGAPEAQRFGQRRQRALDYGMASLVHVALCWFRSTPGCRCPSLPTFTQQTRTPALPKHRGQR